MDVSAEVGVATGSDSGAVDLRVTLRHDDVTSGDATSGRPLDLTLSGLAEAEVKSPAKYDATTPPDTPTSVTSSAAAAAAFKKTMLKRYSK